MPAHITANSVIASADRLTAVRHFCRNRNSTAEINVPAWPMPTQNTKFVMSKRPADRLVQPPRADAGRDLVPDRHDADEQRGERHAERRSTTSRSVCRSIGAQMSRVTSPSVLSPVISGGRRESNRVRHGLLPEPSCPAARQSRRWRGFCTTRR